MSIENGQSSIDIARILEEILQECVSDEELVSRKDEGKSSERKKIVLKKKEVTCCFCV